MAGLFAIVVRSMAHHPIAMMDGAIGGGNVVLRLRRWYVNWHPCRVDHAGKETKEEGDAYLSHSVILCSIVDHSGCIGYQLS